MMSREGESRSTGIGMEAVENPQQEQEQEEEWRREGSRAFERRNPTGQGKNDEMRKKEECLGEWNESNDVWEVMGAM